MTSSRRSGPTLVFRRQRAAFGLWALLCLAVNPALAVVGNAEGPAALENPGVLVPDLPAQDGPLQTRYRDLAVARQDLLFAGFQRSGRSAEIYDNQGLYRAQVFTHQSNSVQSFSVNPTVGSPSEVSYGGTLNLSLWDPVQVEAGYIGGQLHWSDEDFLFNPAASQEVNSWNLAASTQWLDRSWSARVEYARSEQQKGRLLQETQVNQGQALQAEMSLSSDGVLGSGWFDWWRGRALYRSVDQQFYSLGNLNQPRGQDTAQLLVQSRVRGVGMELEWTREGNSTDRSVMEFIPTSDRAGIRLNYQLMNLDRILFLPLGQPVISARYYQRNQWQAPEQVQAQGYELLQESDETGINLLFDHERWQWSLDYLVSDQDHWREEPVTFSAQQPLQPSDWRRETAELNLGWAPRTDFWLNVRARWNDAAELDLANRYQARHYGMQAYLGTLPRNLSLHVEYYYGDQANDVASSQLETQYRSHMGNAKLTWEAMKPSGRNPAMDIYLRSTFNRQLDLANQVEASQRSASLGFELMWSGN